MDVIFSGSMIGCFVIIVDTDVDGVVGEISLDRLVVDGLTLMPSISMM